MINENAGKSRSRGGGTSGSAFPLYGYAGIAVIAAGEILLFSGNRFVGVYFTPIQWSGYILFMDALVKRLKGRSLLSSHPGEFFILLVLSVGSWLIFEAYNLLLGNWKYVGLPENRLARYIGYAWSFATISPGIFLTYELIEHLTGGGRRGSGEGGTEGRAGEVHQLKGARFVVLVAFGAACLVVPILWPSPYMTPLVWVGFVFFLDPINGRIGERSVMAELFAGMPGALLRFFLAGLVCGFIWEFWNYWAIAKWKYIVPYFGDVKLFEMPVLGFLGFLPFAVECFAIYKFMRRLVPITIKERYLG